MNIPAAEPYMEGHNTWCVNRPGTLLLMPVADLAQHAVAGLCFLVQNGYVLFDDVHAEPIPGLEPFRETLDLDLDEGFPLTYFDRYMLTEATAELATSCYAGMLMLQAMGLGGWMFDGIDRHTILGASGDPEVPGLGFRYDTDERWAVPSPTGIRGSSTGTALPTTRRCGRRSTRSPSGSSDPGVRSTPTPPARGARAPGSVPARR